MLWMTIRGWETKARNNERTRHVWTTQGKHMVRCRYIVCSMDRPIRSNRERIVWRLDRSLSSSCFSIFFIFFFFFTFYPLPPSILALRKHIKPTKSHASKISNTFMGIRESELFMLVRFVRATARSSEASVVFRSTQILLDFML